MNNNDLYKYAEQANITIDKADLPKNKALSVQIGRDEYIGIDKNIADDSAEERTCLLHELGHCKTGAFYKLYSPLDIREKHEHKATKWVILNYLPKDELIALQKQNLSISEIAEHFGVTEELIKTAYTYYFEYGVA